MMKCFSFCCLFILASISVRGQVWLEDFTNAAEVTAGTASGTVGGTWSITPPSGGDFERYDAGTIGGMPVGPIFIANDTGTEGVWRSNVFNIGGLGDVVVELAMGALNATAADYVRAYYILGADPTEHLFAQVVGTPGLVSVTPSSAIVSGTTIQIVIRARDNSVGGLSGMGFDNVTVTDIDVLYSIASANWNAGTTWSTIGFAGATCNCTPDEDSRVIIGNNRAVNFNVDGNAAGIEIQNTGTLRWVGNNNDLTIERGGVLDVQAGGTLTRVATTGSTIVFGNYTYGAKISGTLDIGQLNFNLSANSTLTNSGTLTLSTATGLIINGSDGYIFDNSGTWNLTSMDLNNNNITINNTGIIDQSGNFTDVDNGSTFNNSANGHWEFAGTTITNVRLFANNSTNTFEYDGAAQTIITPQDNYWNLALSNSGAKAAAANFSVKGNWTRSGTATFTPSTFRVTLNGTAAQTITAVGGETFSNLTINNTFAAIPQIIAANNITATANLTMTQGVVNLGGNTFALGTAGGTSTLTRTASTTTNWFYGGSFRRFWPNGTTITNATAFYGLFPLGSSTASSYRPFVITSTGNTTAAGSYIVTHTNSNTTTDLTPVYDDDPTAVVTNIVRKHNSSFVGLNTGVTTGGTFTIAATMTDLAAGVLGNIRLAVNLAATTVTNVGTHVAATGSAPNPTASRSGVATAGISNDFRITTTSIANTPLPVELFAFGAKLNGDIVNVEWTTASEKNNHYFTVERTRDFETFYPLGRIEGKGNSSTKQVYRFSDNAPFDGRSYYRLAQTDFDGTTTYSDAVMIKFDLTAPMLQVYPNPSNGKSISITIPGISTDENISLQIIDQHGKMVRSFEIAKDKTGNHSQALNLESLKAGVYVFKAGRTNQLIKKVVIE